MVESNCDEERLARIEHMIEKLQRESAAFTSVAASLVAMPTPQAPAATTADRRTKPRIGAFLSPSCGSRMAPP